MAAQPITRDKPRAQRLLLTVEQDNRLHREAKYQGKSLQDFMHTATMRAIGESEEERRRRKEERERSGTVNQKQAKGGLGLRRTSSRRDRDEEDQIDDGDGATGGLSPFPAEDFVQPTAPAAAPSTPSHAIVEELAIYVRTGANWQRPARMSEARKILSTKPSEERQTLTAALEERVAQLDGKKAGMFEQLKKGFLGL